MKAVLFILSVATATLSFGQRWHLNSVDSTKQFSYEYWFQFENLDDTSTFELTKRNGMDSSTIYLFENSGSNDVFADIRVEQLGTDSVFHLLPFYNGEATGYFGAGTYRIVAYAPRYDRFETIVKLEEGEYFELKIYLGLGPELTVYQINSKTELEEKTLLEIMQCVKGHRSKPFEKCSRIEDYYISVQI